MCAQVKDDQILLLIDAYDVLLFPSTHTIGRTFREHFSHPIVFSAERSMWPDVGLIPMYPDSTQRLLELGNPCDTLLATQAWTEVT